MCDNAGFRRGQTVDDQYKQCDALIPAVEEKVNKNGELTLKCDLQDTSPLAITCIWRLPDGITECEVRTAYMRTSRKLKKWIILPLSDVN